MKHTVIIGLPKNTNFSDNGLVVLIDYFDRSLQLEKTWENLPDNVITLKMPSSYAIKSFKPGWIDELHINITFTIQQTNFELTNWYDRLKVGGKVYLPDEPFMESLLEGYKDRFTIIKHPSSWELVKCPSKNSLKV